MERTPTDRLPTVVATSAVYGEDPVGSDDPAELFHEASKLYPSFAARSMAGADRLTNDPALQATSRRAVRKHLHRPAVRLPPPRFPAMLLEDAIQARVSEREFGDAAVTLSELATLLFAAYGLTRGSDDVPGLVRRTVPSGGALFPLELTVVARHVAELAEGLYHYDPEDRLLETLATGVGPVEALVEASLYRDVTESAAASIVVAATFWRTRFKYGLRGYRFALLEAGHIAQNLLLVAGALGLASVPLGGFYDRQIDHLLALDGVNESALYVLCVGRRKARARLVPESV